ncbi:MAG: glycosyltransferase family 39 protein [Acidobacteria bacterium]|nr:glycosyltransferase family 39 protein [Acidobacteriota bacterium]MCA1610322.1 glycosyltransferase family 39 protein [Acidobacteriota bacterium]
MRAAGARDPAGRIARAAFAAFFPALALYAVLTRWPLVSEGMWRDEAAAIYVAKAPNAAEFLNRQLSTEYTPPLFDATLAVVGRIVGFREMPLKLIAAGFTLLSVAGIVVLAGELFGSFAAVAAATLAVSNPILIRLFAELRVYSLSILLATLAVLLTSRILRAGTAARFRQGAALAAALSVLAYSHMAGMLVAASVGAIGTALLLHRAYRHAGRLLFAASACAGAVFSVWVPTAWSQFRAGVPYQKPLSAAARWKMLALRMVDVFPVFGGRWVAVGLAAAMAAGAAAVIVHRARTRPNASGFLLTTAAASGTTLFLGLYTGTNRYLAIPAALAAVAAAGLFGAILRLAPDGARVRRTLLRVAVAALLAGYFAAGASTLRKDLRKSPSSLDKSGIRSLCRHRMVREGDLVLVTPDYLASTLWYYCGGAPVIRGAALGPAALMLDWREYAGIWLSPSLVPRAVERVRSEAPAHFFLLMDADWYGPPMNYSPISRNLRAALGAPYSEVGVSQWRGRLESATLVEFARRPASP